jgi:hypothetical protein
MILETHISLRLHTPTKKSKTNPILINSYKLPVHFNMTPEGRAAFLSALNQPCYFVCFFALFVTCFLHDVAATVPIEDQDKWQICPCLPSCSLTFNHWKINGTNWKHVYPTNRTLKAVISNISQSSGWMTMLRTYNWRAIHYRQERTAASCKTRGGGRCIFLNNSWCTISKEVSRFFLLEVEYLMISCRPHYLPREFSSVFFIAVYIPPQTEAGTQWAVFHCEQTGKRSSRGGAPSGLGL